MKLTLQEQKILNVQINETHAFLKPKNYCVVITHRETQQVWLVEKFTTFRVCLKQMPWLYDDFKKFKYELRIIQ